jgi:hypothetical protein
MISNGPWGHFLVGLSPQLWAMTISILHLVFIYPHDSQIKMASSRRVVPLSWKVSMIFACLSCGIFFIYILYIVPKKIEVGKILPK